MPQTTGSEYGGGTTVINSQGGQMASGSRGPFIRCFRTGSKAGNVAMTVKVPIGVRWNIVSAGIYLDTDANAADRYATVQINDSDSNRVCLLIYSSAIVANSIVNTEVGPSEVDSFELNFPYPMVDGMQLYFAVANGVAGDAWTGYFTVMEWKI